MQNVHPYFVHFPIAIISVGLLWDLLSVIFKKDSLRIAGWWAQLFGIIAIVGTVITGLIAESTVGHSEASHEIMETHETLMLFVAGMTGVLFLWRILLKMNLPIKVFPLVIYFILGGSAIVTLLYGAHLGGRLVYEFGVGGSAVTQTGGAGHRHQEEDEGEGETEHEHEAEAKGAVIPDTSGVLKTSQKQTHTHKNGNQHDH